MPRSRKIPSLRSGPLRSREWSRNLSGNWRTTARAPARPRTRSARTRTAGRRPCPALLCPAGPHLVQPGMFWPTLGPGSAGEALQPRNGTCPRRFWAAGPGPGLVFFFLKRVHPIFLFVVVIVLGLFVCFKRKPDPTFLPRCKRKPLAQHNGGRAVRAAADANRGEGERGEAEVPVVGGPQEQGLAARAAVRGGVTAVHRRGHRVLLVPCGESGTGLARAAAAAQPRAAPAGSHYLEMAAGSWGLRV